MSMFTVFWVVSSVVATSIAISQPPGVFLEPDYDVFFKHGETVQLPCVAVGDPRPEYYWKRNEIEFNPSGNDARVVQLPNAGTLVINSPEDKDEGIFQCFAKNSFGTSATKKINLRQAKLKNFVFESPKTFTPKVGEPFTLPCVPPESVPPPTVFWVHRLATGGIDVVNYNQRVSMDREYRLRFANIQPEDAMSGMPYTCVAMNSFMRRNSQGPLYRISPMGGKAQWMPVKYMWADQDDRFGLRGETFSVKCIFSGNPTPDVHWERTDNKSLPTRAQMKSFAQELEITNIQFEDAGGYQCWATNHASGGNRQYRMFNIRVNAKPYFVQAPQDVEVGVGANVEFNCVAGGVPAPDVEWYIDGVPLKSVKDPRITGPRFKRPLENKIFIEKVEQTDHMVIQCNASNIHGYVFADVYLNVLSESPTIITPPPARKVAAEATAVSLTCRTTGKPDPIITWYKDGEQITGGRYKIAKSGDLQIRSLVLADSGLFKCEAKNVFNITSAAGSLVVRRKTRIEHMPLDLEVNGGKEAKFTCSGTTDPEEVDNFKIVWLKDGQRIKINDQRMTENRQDNSLTISGAIQRDSGTYTCIATNGLDNHSASAVLIVRDRPDPPSDVTLEWCNVNATLNWMPGSFNNAPVQYFVLQYNTSFSPDQWNFGVKVNASLNKVNMTLTPYGSYSFRVIAYNKIGASNPSFQTSKVCSTKPDRPSHHPRNLRTLGHQQGKLYIEWTPMPPLQHNGPGFHYVLQILRVGAQQESHTLNVPVHNWRTNHYELSTGFVYEPYRITVRARNSMGEAAEDPATILGHSYEGTPSVTPTNLVAEEVADTYVTFKWDFDRSEINKPNTKIRGEFRGFKIWEQNRRTQTVRDYDIAPLPRENMTVNTFSSRVDVLLPNKNMEAQIHVKNNYYISSPSETVRFKTQPGLPGPVEYFRIVNVGDTHVNLEWGSPSENRGDLLGYDISYQLVDGLYLGEVQDRLPQIDDPHTTNAYLSGLCHSSKYRIFIGARTAAGRGERFFLEVMTTKPGQPRMPRFTISNIGTTSFNVSWWINAYASSGTIVFVEYRTSDGSEWIRTTDEMVNTWRNISNLEPGTKYEVRIKTTNGPIIAASAIEDVTTMGTSMASALIGNIGWFIGMILAILLLAALVVCFVVCYNKGFRFAQKVGFSYHDRGDHRGSYTGRYDNTAHMAHGSQQFGSEPAGYNNDYYDDRDNNDVDEADEGGFRKVLQSYHNGDTQGHGHYHLPNDNHQGYSDRAAEQFGAENNQHEQDDQYSNVDLDDPNYQTPASGYGDADYDDDNREDDYNRDDDDNRDESFAAYDSQYDDHQNYNSDHRHGNRIDHEPYYNIGSSIASSTVSLGSKPGSSTFV